MLNMIVKNEVKQLGKDLLKPNMCDINWEKYDYPPKMNIIHFSKYDIPNTNNYYLYYALQNAFLGTIFFYAFNLIINLLS